MSRSDKKGAGNALDIDEAAVLELETRLGGALLRPAGDGFEAARRLWNGEIDKRPALIVCCSGIADVIEALRFARDQELVLAVKSGGHGVAGTALCDDGLVVDLSGMKGVRVDPSRREAWVQPGVRWGDIDRETLAFELALPGGIVSTTGIAGFTLGGGIGWLSRMYGLTCDCLRSVDIVTADARFLTVSASQYPDLFWGIRGGGGNFGVVTTFHYRLQRIPPLVTAGTVLYPFEHAEEVMVFFRQYAATLPETATMMATMRVAPSTPYLPVDFEGKLVVGLTLCHVGGLAQGREIARPLKTFRRPIVDTLGPKPYRQLQCMLDVSQPPGRLQYWKSEYLSRISDRMIATALHYANEITSPHSMISWFQLGAAISRVQEEDTAYSHREASFLFTIGSSWEDLDNTDRHKEWTKGLWTAVRKDSLKAGYLNFLSADEGERRVIAAYGADKYQRLQSLKSKYDPTNLFRVNQNIKPSG